ncbi:MAG: hypothetical protein ACTSX4_03795 [Candidatus Helarchaeota archaeon]
MSDIIIKIKDILRSKPMKIILLVLCYMMLIISLIGSFVYVFFDFTILGILIAIIAPSLSAFIVFWAIIPTIVIIRLQFWNKKKRVLIILGIAAFIILASFYPYYSIPASIINAETEMTYTYGSAYKNLDTTGMQVMPYNIWYSFNPPNYDHLITVTRDNVYTITSYGDSLLYDMYLPKGYASKAAGTIPIIVNIHGGGWTLGSKGPANMQQRSKYLASQGYAVFDVSYGLYSIENLTKNMGVNLQPIISLLLGIPGSEKYFPAYKHDYTLPEQVQNLGQFFLNLSTYIKSTIPQLNLSRVFTMGGSAGGTLSSVISTGYNSTVLGDLFPDNISIIGGIHFYPPTDMLKMKIAVAEGRLGAFPAAESIFGVLFNASGSSLAGLLRNYSSAYLVTLPTIKNKPDLLIIHGSKDNLVPYYEQGVSFKYICRQWGTRATLITIYGGGHAFDLTFTSPGFQISQYYIERFIKLTLEAA